MDILATIKRISGRSIVEGQNGLIGEWLKYYRGNYDNLYYKVDVGYGEPIKLTKKTLNMPKKISEDFSNFLLNEDCQIIVPSNVQENLNAYLKREMFWSKTNALLEQAMALSIGAIVEGVKGLEVNENGVLSKKGKLKVRYINATKVYPITIEDGKIIECAFASANTEYTNLELHLLNENGNYVVKMCKIHNKSNAIIPFEDGSEIIEFDTLNNIPLFQLFYPNIVNNLDVNSRLPISVYANCLDNFDAVDEKYDDFNIEFKNGKKRIFVNSELWKVDTMTGNVVKTFDTNDTLFYTLNFQNNEKPLIESSSDPLREQSYINAIETELSLITMKVGLGKNYYTFNATEKAKTATEVVAMTSETIKTMKKHELVVKEALIGFVKAIQYLSNNFVEDELLGQLGEFPEKDIDVIFDDSVFEDKNTEQTRDLTNVNAGLMSEVEYRMRWFGEDEKSAKKYVYDNLRFKLINNNLPALNGGAMTPEDFVEICYGDKTDEEKQVIVQYILEKQNQSSISALDFQNPDNPEDDYFSFSE